jgi:plasmid stabilization system protein ParE
MKIRYLPGALQDIDEALAYYSERSPLTAENFVRAVRIEEKLIQDFPGIASPLGSRLRVLPVSRFPYVLVYYQAGAEIVMVAVAHVKRRPSYWKARLRDEH